MTPHRSPNAEDDDYVVTTDRVVTIPNILSVLRLVLIGVYCWLVLGLQADLAAVIVLIISGITDYLDGYIARRWSQVSAIGQLLDPLVDRITIAAVVVTLALRDIIPWWLVAALVARELVLLVLLPPLRRRGLSALPVHYLGKAATFVLFVGFPLLLAGAGPSDWQAVLDVVGWAVVIWGVGLYWYGAVLYLEQTVRIVRACPLPRPLPRALP